MEYFSKKRFHGLIHEQKYPLSEPGGKYWLLGDGCNSNPMFQGVDSLSHAFIHGSWCTASGTINKMKKDWKGILKKNHNPAPLIQDLTRRGWDTFIYKQHIIDIMERRGHVKEICELWGLYKSTFLHQVDEANKHYHLQKTSEINRWVRKKMNPLPPECCFSIVVFWFLGPTFRPTLGCLLSYQLLK